MGVSRLGVCSDPAHTGPGWGLWATGTMQIHFSSQETSSSSLPMPTDCLRARDLSWELLASGMAALPGTGRAWRWWGSDSVGGAHGLCPIGTRDAEGRAVLFLCAQSPAWLHPQCSPHEFLRLLLYLRSIPRLVGQRWVGGGGEQSLNRERQGPAIDKKLPFRPQVQALGLTVLVDARVCAPSTSLLQGLCQLQVSTELEPPPAPQNMPLICFILVDAEDQTWASHMLNIHPSLLRHSLTIYLVRDGG